jgi:hypothetical protein
MSSEFRSNDPLSLFFSFVVIAHKNSPTPFKKLGQILIKILNIKNVNVTGTVSQKIVMKVET